MNRRVAISTTLALLLVTLCVVVWMPRRAPRPEPVEALAEPRPETHPAVSQPATQVSPLPAVQRSNREIPTFGPVGISGQVLQAVTRAPVAGASVGIRTDVPGELAEPRDPVLSTQTDEDGRFHFEGVLGGLYQALASAPGHFDTVASGVSPNERITLILERDPGIPSRAILARETGLEPLAWTKVAFALLDGSWTFETESDAHGGLRLHGLRRDAFDEALADGAVRAIVPVYASAHVVSSEELDGFEGEPVQPIVVVEPGIAVVGRTVDAESGRPVPNAIVLADSGHGVTTGSDGSFELRGVEEGLSAFAEGYAPTYHDLASGGGAVEGPVVVRLQEGVVLLGALRTQDGTPVEAARLRVHTKNPDATPVPGWLLAPLREHWSAATDSSGSYRISGIGAPVLELPGAVDLEVSLVSWNGSILEEVGVPVDAGEARQDITLDLATLEGRVVSEDGEPVVDATVLALAAGDRVRVATRTDEAGDFRIPLLPTGSARVVVYVDEAVVGTSVATLPGPPVELRIGEGRSVSGVVLLGRSERPLSGFPVRLLTEGAASAPLRSTKTGERGDFAFESVPEGRYVLEVRAEPEVLPFDAWLPEHRKSIEVPGTRKGLQISYPAHPSAPVSFRFLVRDGAGALLPLDKAVELRVTRYARGSFQVGRLRDAAGQPRRWSATGKLQAHFREGRYTFRCRADVGGRAMTRDETVEVSDGQPVSCDFVFDLDR